MRKPKYEEINLLQDKCKQQSAEQCVQHVTTYVKGWRDKYTVTYTYMKYVQKNMQPAEPDGIGCLLGRECSG